MMRISKATRVRRWFTPLLIVALCCVSLAHKRAAPVSTKPENEIKAAYLLNFTRYVTWPESSFGDETSPVVIGVLGENSFNGALIRTITGRTSHGRPIVARQLSESHEAEDCHVVFVDSETRDLLSVLRLLEGKPILTVSDSDRFLRNGGMIELVRTRDTMQFEVNLPAVEKTELRISSRMLNLARRVVGGYRSRGRE